MRSITVIALIALSACNAGNIAGTTAPDLSTTSPSTPSSTLPPVIECPGVGEFQEGGGIADVPGEGSDSRRLGRISWQARDQCETFQFDFETAEGAPATTVPAIRIDHLESYQVVRLSLGVDATVVTDQLVESGLVERLYVVRSLSGEMFVDLHLAAPAAVRASTSSSPARLTLDLRPGFVPFVGESAVADNVVLTSPLDGAEVAGSVQLLGYARTFEANVLAVVTQAGTLVSETNTTAADSIATWGEYRLQVEVPPGDVSVFVGEASAEDGSLEGLTIGLTAN